MTRDMFIRPAKRLWPTDFYDAVEVAAILTVSTRIPLEMTRREHILTSKGGLKWWLFGDVLDCFAGRRRGA